MGHGQSLSHHSAARGAIVTSLSALTPFASILAVKVEEPVSMEMDNHMAEKDDSCYDNAEAAFSDDEDDLNSKGEERGQLSATALEYFCVATMRIATVRLRAGRCLAGTFPS